jgi:hypothetical protein
MKKSILEILRLTKGHPLPSVTLQKELGIRERQTIGDNAFQDALIQLRNKGFVDYQIDGLTGDHKYTITFEGEACLGDA